MTQRGPQGQRGSVQRRQDRGGRKEERLQAFGTRDKSMHLRDSRSGDRNIEIREKGALYFMLQKLKNNDTGFESDS